VLITSSLTMALAVHAAEAGKRRALVGFLVLTMALGATFLVVKGFEYHHKWVDHLIRGRRSRFTAWTRSTRRSSSRSTSR